MTSTRSMKPMSVRGSSSSGSFTLSRHSQTSNSRSVLMMSVSMPLLRRDLNRCVGKLLFLRLHVDAVEARGVQAEDLLLDLIGQLHATFLCDVFGNLEIPELLHQPTRCPDRIIRTEQEVVLSDPEEQFRDHFREI